MLSQTMNLQRAEVSYLFSLQGCCDSVFVRLQTCVNSYETDLNTFKLDSHYEPQKEEQRKENKPDRLRKCTFLM